MKFLEGFGHSFQVLEVFFEILFTILSIRKKDYKNNPASMIKVSVRLPFFECNRPMNYYISTIESLINY